MPKQLKSIGLHEDDWELRGVLALWTLHETRILCIKQIENLTKKKLMSLEKKKELLYQYNLIYKDITSKKITTISDILFYENAAQSTLRMLADFGMDVSSEMLKRINPTKGKNHP